MLFVRKKKLEEFKNQLTGRREEVVGFIKSCEEAVGFTKTSEDVSGVFDSWNEKIIRLNELERVLFAFNDMFGLWGEED